MTDDDVDVDDACEPDEVCTSNSTDASLGVTHIEPVTNNVGCTISDDFVVPPPALRRSTGHPESVPGAFSIVPGGQSNMLTRGHRSQPTGEVSSVAEGNSVSLAQAEMVVRATLVSENPDPEQGATASTASTTEKTPSSRNDLTSLLTNGKFQCFVIFILCILAGMAVAVVVTMNRGKAVSAKANIEFLTPQPAPISGPNSLHLQAPSNIAYASPSSPSQPTAFAQAPAAPLCR